MQSGANGGPSNFAQFSSNVRSVTSWKPFLKGFLYTIGLIGLLMLLWQKAGTVNRDMKPSLEALKKILPEKIHVIRHPDNSIEIPDEFWRALEVKMREEGLSGPGGSGVFEWNEFLTKNNYKILRQMRGDIRASVNSLVHEIVDLPFFVDLVEKEYSKLSALVDKKVEEKVKEKLKAASKSIAKEAAKSAVLDHVRIESLALTNLIANSEISLRKVNYFSLRLGTRINTYETSSTLDMHNRAPSTFTWLYRKLIAGHHNGPATALQKWDELGECWCASPDDNGHGLAQLSVSLGVPVIPTQVTIDHLPKEASLEIGSAPKRIEIWAESDEADAAAPDCGEGEEGWVCLGTVSYNVHGGNYIQTFNLDARLQKPVHKTIVRVKENWGAPHTCLYRVRLHGIRSPGEKA
jgi:SUN domain-containing protein 1/2